MSQIFEGMTEKEQNEKAINLVNAKINKIADTSKSKSEKLSAGNVQNEQKKSKNKVKNDQVFQHGSLKKRTLH